MKANTAAERTERSKHGEPGSSPVTRARARKRERSAAVENVEATTRVSVPGEGVASVADGVVVLGLPPIRRVFRARRLYPQRPHLRSHKAPTVTPMTLSSRASALAPGDKKGRDRVV